MERDADAVDNLDGGNITVPEGQALNSTILNYYKKFGRKRDLEQFFSLSTAQGEVKDPTSLFWRRMKSQNDSSDSGEKSRESSMEVCRISIKCSVPDPDPSSSQDVNRNIKSDSESPPIIVEEAPLDTSRPSDDESVKSDDNHSQKSVDAIDTSINKAISPSSSVTSQRKLEWDSLADVGYANESDKKTTSSCLSTLERLALKQQYSNNDTKESLIGLPTAHSTPVDENDSKPKGKKGSKTTKIYRREVDFVEFNVPQGSDNPSQSINVNLTKHISFNVEKDGGVKVDNVNKDVIVTPEKVSVETEVTPQVKMDKEIQTSLVRTKDKSSSSFETPKGQGIPILINLNTIKKRNRRRKLKTVRKKLRTKKKTEADKENLPVLEKSGEQVSDAESFEYMPGHIYNQNQMNKDVNPPNTSGNISSHASGNKSSLESSAPTTDSSKGSRHSFTKDLEKSINLIKAALNKRHDDSELKNKLIKEVVERLLKSRYRDKDTTRDFLSGLRCNSKKLGLGESNTTTSTSDANNTAEKVSRPRKSILRVDKFNANAIASTSQSAPNLPSVSNSERPVTSNLINALITSNTESDLSSKEKTSSDTAFAKTASEELYHKYLNALRKEEAYKRHLRDKETFLKQKLVCSDTAFNVPPRIDVKNQLRLKELMKDLTRNNYDDGSGDASKLEGGFNSNLDIRCRNTGRQRSHSVFTLSSSPTSEQNKRVDLKKNAAKDLTKAGHSKEGNHYCCCPHHYANKLGVADSFVQVNIKNDEQKVPTKYDQEVRTCGKHVKETPRSAVTRIVEDNTGDLKYVCVCSKKVDSEEPTDNMLVYKCSRLTNKAIQSHCDCNEHQEMLKKRGLRKAGIADDEMSKLSKCSQTNLKVNYSSHTHDGKETVCIHEAIRCIQTDISIDPKIAEPVLNDIKFIKNCDCVKLIREQFRQVSKSSIGSDANAQKKDVLIDDSSESDRISSCGSGLCQNRFKHGQTTTRPVDVEVQSGIEKPNNTEKNVEGNFVIPIKGTNMTLKVSLGSNSTKPVRTDVEAVTDAISTLEDATSLREECSKAVQSQNNDIFTQCGPKPPNLNTIYRKDGFFSLQTEPVNLQKPFLRANTHTGIIDRGCDIQNDLLDQYFDRQQQKMHENVSDDRQYQRSEKKYETNINPKHKEPGQDRLRDMDPSCQTSSSTGSTKCGFVPKGAYKDNEELRTQKSINSCGPDVPQKSIRKTPVVDANFEIDETNNLAGYSGYRNIKPSGFDTERSQGSMPRSILPSKSACGCPNSAVCGGQCRGDAACRKQPSFVDFERTQVSRGFIFDDPNERHARNPAESLKYKNTKTESSENEDYYTNAYGDKQEYRDPKTGQYLRSDPQMTPREEDNMMCQSCPSGQPPYGRHENTEDFRRQNVYKEDKLEYIKQNPGTRFDSNPTSPRKYSGQENYQEYKDQNVYAKDTDYQQDQVINRSDVDPTGAPYQTKQVYSYKNTQNSKDNQEDSEYKNEAVYFSPRSDTLQQSAKGIPRLELGPEFQNENNTQPERINCAQSARSKRQESPKKLGSSRIGQNSRPASPFRQIQSNYQGYIPKDRETVATARSNSLPSKPQALQKCTCPPSSKCGGKCQGNCFGQDGKTRSQSLPQNTLGGILPKDPGLVKKGLRMGTLPSSTETENDPQTSNTEGSREQKRSAKEVAGSKDLIMNVIQDITKKYAKKDIEKCQRKKCFKEIISILNYLLETEDSIDTEAKKYLKLTESSSSEIEMKQTQGEETSSSNMKKQSSSYASQGVGLEDNIVLSKSRQTTSKQVRSVGSGTRTEFESTTKTEESGKRLVDKSVQLSEKGSNSPKRLTESSDIPQSTDLPCTSSDSATCKVLNKIRKECEKYHQKRCKHHLSAKKCECSSTSVSCDHCKRVHQRLCRSHKCKGHRSRGHCEKVKKKCVAYNLIIQTSESMISEETAYDKNCRPLKNIIVKVPPKRKQGIESVAYKEVIQTEIPYSSPKFEGRTQRSRSLPNENYLSSTDDMCGRNRQTVFTVRDYLEKNRPDFVEQYAKRQNCLKIISEARANNRAAQRELLSMQVQMGGHAPLRKLSATDLHRLAKELGVNLRQTKVPPKLISEREMKKHSEKIYKSLPEVTRKKEQMKKENIKKTNLLMANIFKKNLQKKALRGTVNLSNYSPVIKI